MVPHGLMVTMYGQTGAQSESSELDLAGLVCNKYGNDQCINPMKGKDGGQTWEYRAGYIDGMIEGRKKRSLTLIRQ